ncbi:uncharacterized protein LOC134330202 [Trichomycterus rosablanca]|uniref:uncharacterized protein LOC134330202 n=1 Tax=Trichomycterus rosablanca TaxID=2290929 RepID=UPI002F356A62
MFSDAPVQRLKVQRLKVQRLKVQILKVQRLKGLQILMIPWILQEILVILVILEILVILKILEILVRVLDYRWRRLNLLCHPAPFIQRIRGITALFWTVALWPGGALRPSAVDSPVEVRVLDYRWKRLNLLYHPAPFIQRIQEITALFRTVALWPGGALRPSAVDSPVEVRVLDYRWRRLNQPHHRAPSVHSTPPPDSDGCDTKTSSSV